MPCYKPLSAWQLDSGDIVFQETGAVKRPLFLPCGRCIGCRIERARVWAVRCMHEAHMHDYSSFVTLTYDDDKLPYRGSLDYKDLRLFFKRLRRLMGPFRYFACGEYGELLGRPHYHACLFGVYFGDRELFTESGSGSRIYTSRLLSKLWPNGYASVGDVTFSSARYVAGYVTKKVSERVAEERYLRFDEYGVAYWLEPEEGRMSRRPGIGASWWQAYGEEVLRRGNVVMDGVEMKVPRYYGKLCSDPAYDFVEFQAQQKFNDEDSTPERLAVREVVKQAQVAQRKRLVE